MEYTAILRKVVGKSARDSPEGIMGDFELFCSSKKFERMAREAMDVCLPMLKESNKSRFDSYSVRNSVLSISHITFRDFSDNLSRNSFIQRSQRRPQRDGHSRKTGKWSCSFLVLMSFSKEVFERGTSIGRLSAFSGSGFAQISG